MNSHRVPAQRQHFGGGLERLALTSASPQAAAHSKAVVPPCSLPRDLSLALAAWTAYTPPKEGLFPARWLTLAEPLAYDWMGRHHRWEGDSGEGTIKGADDASEEVSYAQVAHEFLDRVVRPFARCGADSARVRVVWWIG